MKSKQEPTPTPERPFEPLSQEQRTDLAEWLERTKPDLRPVSQEQQNTQPVESQTLSATEQTVHDAMMRATVDVRSPARVRPADEKPFNLQEWSQQAAEEAAANLRSTTLMGGKAASDYAQREADSLREECERREADMDSRRRYNSGVAAICGLFGTFALPFAGSKAGLHEDPWMTILVILGLTGGWVLGATYIYPMFFTENGTAKPHTVRVESSVLKLRQRMCTTGLHSWDKLIISKTCRVCGKRQAI